MKDVIRTIIVAIMNAEARLAVMKYRPRMMIVTGSVGKTSTKDALYTALSPYAFVRKSEKSYNSDIGLPLTVLGVPNGWGNPLEWFKNIVDGFLLLLISAKYPTWLIAEVGADRPGDLSRSLAWLKPNVVVATRIPDVPVHVEYYSSPEEVFTEESFFLTRLRDGGTAVIAADDARLKNFPLRTGVRRITYGFDHEASVRIMRTHTLMKQGLPTGTSFDLVYEGVKEHFSLPGVIGPTPILAVAGGVTGALAAGAPLAGLSDRFKDYQAPPSRMRLISGIKNTMLIDDTYNSSPAAAEVALRTLKETDVKGRRIAIMGDMMELGSYTTDEHEKIGRIAAETADLLITVGVRARGIATGAARAGMPAERIQALERGPDAASYVLSIIAEGDLVLIKGSQSVRLERVTKALMAEPHNAKSLLCRQDDEWLAR